MCLGGGFVFMNLSFYDYVFMREANIAQQSNVGTAGQVARAVGQTAVGAVSGLMGIDSIIQAAGLAGQIFSLIKSRQDAGNLIKQAMAIPDSARGNVPNSEIFDIDDSLWDDKTGILSPVAKNEIMGLVQSRIQQIASDPKSVTPDSLKGFANKIAIEYLQKKSVGAQKV